jgi:hypothetical protein
MVFLALLLGLTGGLLCYSLIAHAAWARAIFDAVLVADLVAMLFVAGHHRRLVWVALGLGLLNVSVSVASYAIDQPWIDHASGWADLAFLGLVTVVLLAGVLHNERVTAVKIYSALTVYLLLGFLWSGFYMLLENAQPGSFTVAQLNMTPGYEPYLRRYDVSNPIYLSFVTLTTLGFGDVTPTTIPARTLVLLEAIVGQLYLAVLVARLVSLHITHSLLAEAENAAMAATGPPPAALAPSADDAARLLAEWRALLAQQQAQIDQLEAQVRVLTAARR